MGQRMGTEARAYYFCVTGFGSSAFFYFDNLGSPPPTFAPKLVS